MSRFFFLGGMFMRRMSKPYEFDAEYYLEDVNENLSKGMSVLQAYNYQPLIVALFNKCIDDPISWSIDSEAYFINADYEMHEVSFSIDYGSVSFSDMHKDLNKKLVDNLNQQSIPEGFVLHKIQLYIKAKARFRSPITRGQYFKILNKGNQ